MVDPWINCGLAALEDSFGELGEDKLVSRRVYGTGVCYVTLPVVDNKLYLMIDT